LEFTAGAKGREGGGAQIFQSRYHTKGARTASATLKHRVVTDAQAGRGGQPRQVVQNSSRGACRLVKHIAHQPRLWQTAHVPPLDRNHSLCCSRLSLSLSPPLQPHTHVYRAPHMTQVECLGLNVWDLQPALRAGRGGAAGAPPTCWVECLGFTGVPRV